MFSKDKNIDPQKIEQREQYDYARARIKQKKRLMRHFIVFLAGSVLLIIINPLLGIGKDFFIKDWFIWAILLWAFLFIVHLLNVFFMNRFMGKEWENRQLEKLKAKQEKKIAQLQQKIEKELPTPEVKKNDENQSLTTENQ
ncbi:MAG: 2TM domain-containing protein [Flavobacteriaceae bacterium]|nr:2TM domain-containing protein [Flavobacteriaceae bacterium]